MVWAKTPLFNSRLQLVCPTMELFHVYKKALEVVWRTPHLFFPFLAPLMHSFYKKSKVKSKPHLKQIEIVFSTCAPASCECQGPEPSSEFDFILWILPPCGTSLDHVYLHLDCLFISEPRVCLATFVSYSFGMSSFLCINLLQEKRLGLVSRESTCFPAR